MSLLSLPLCAWNDHRQQHFISQPDHCPRGDLFVPHCTRLSAPVGMFLPPPCCLLPKTLLSASRDTGVKALGGRCPLRPVRRVLVSVCPAQTPHAPTSRTRPTRHEKSFTPLYPRPRDGRFVPPSVCPAGPPRRPRVAFTTCSRRLPGGGGGRPFPQSRRSGLGAAALCESLVRGAVPRGPGEMRAALGPHALPPLGYPRGHARTEVTRGHARTKVTGGHARTKVTRGHAHEGDRGHARCVPEAWRERRTCGSRRRRRFRWDQTRAFEPFLLRGLEDRPPVEEEDSATPGRRLPVGQSLLQGGSAGAGDGLKPRGARSHLPSSRRRSAETGQLSPAGTRITAHATRPVGR